MLDEMGSVLELVGINGGIGIALFLLLRWLLEKSVTAKYDIFKEREIGAIKKQLSIDFEKSAMVLNSQKESYKNVLRKMHETVRKLEPDSESRDWKYLYKPDIDSLKTVLAEESLFIPSTCHKALDLFVETVQELIYQEGYSPPENTTIENRFHILLEIADLFTDSFKWQIGILRGEDPLSKIDEMRARNLDTTAPCHELCTP